MNLLGFTLMRLRDDLLVESDTINHKEDIDEGTV
jgi:hypothetical protein